MEKRTGEVHGIVGVPRDANTRIVAVAPQRTDGGIQASAHATFQVIDFPQGQLSPEARAAFQHALDIWARLINSPVTIKVVVGSGAPSGYLGTSSPPIYRNFPNAPAIS
jgi:hypothetical protein